MKQSKVELIDRILDGDDDNEATPMLVDFITQEIMTVENNEAIDLLHAVITKAIYDYDQKPQQHLQPIDHLINMAINHKVEGVIL